MIYTQYLSIFWYTHNTPIQYSIGGESHKKRLTLVVTLVLRNTQILSSKCFMYYPEFLSNQKSGKYVADIFKLWQWWGNNDVLHNNLRDFHLHDEMGFSIIQRSKLWSGKKNAQKLRKLANVLRCEKKCSIKRTK